jgi:hypothetical protein
MNDAPIAALNLLLIQPHIATVARLAFVAPTVPAGESLPAWAQQGT